VYQSSSGAPALGGSPFPHALEIPFVFDTLGRRQQLLVSGSRRPCRDPMHARLALARMGDPATMVPALRTTGHRRRALDTTRAAHGSGRRPPGVGDGQRPIIEPRPDTRGRALRGDAGAVASARRSQCAAVRSGSAVEAQTAPSPRWSARDRVRTHSSTPARPPRADDPLASVPEGETFIEIGNPIRRSSLNLRTGQARHGASEP
jgi:hypothetical protein